MATSVQFTKGEVVVLENAIANRIVARKLANKIDGVGSDRSGAIGTGTALSVDEQSAGQIHLTKITIASLSVTMTDGGAAGSIGSKLLYTFQQGLVKILGARFNLTVTAASGIGATAALKASLGSAAAATNDTLNLTKANIIPSTSTSLVGSAGSPSGKSITTAIVALTDNSGGSASNTIAAQTGAYVQATQQNTIASLASKINELVATLTLLGPSLDPILDGVSAAAALYLNFGVADADSTANSTLTVSGTVSFAWMNCGL